MIGFFYIAAIILLGFVIPEAYNDKFSGTYEQEILNRGLSLLCAVTIAFFLFAADTMEGIWYVVALMLMVGSIGYTGVITFTKSRQLTKSTSSALLSVLMQFLSVAGFAIVIILIIGAWAGSGRKEKRR